MIGLLHYYRRRTDTMYPTTPRGMFPEVALDNSDKRDPQFPWNYPSQSKGVMIDTAIYGW
jgi:hypothetical protein